MTIKRTVETGIKECTRKDGSIGYQVHHADCCFMVGTLEVAREFRKAIVEWGDKTKEAGAGYRKLFKRVRKEQSK